MGLIPSYCPQLKWAELWLTRAPYLFEIRPKQQARGARQGWMRMDSQSLLHEISGYCRRVGMAESTFGRLAVNDGKLVSRLRFGGRVTVETVERVRDFMVRHKPDAARVRAAAAPAPVAVSPPLARPLA